MNVRFLLVALVGLIQPTVSSAEPEIRLAFYGWQSAAVGCFEWTGGEQPEPVNLFLPAMMGMETVGSFYHFGIRSHTLPAYGCDLADTAADSGCGGYDLTAWFEPGGVVIGHVNISDQNCMIEGDEWLGHHPTDFDHIRVEFIDGSPCNDTTWVEIPINWVWYGEEPWLWVPNFEDDTVSRVDVSERSVDTVIPVGDGPAGIAVGPDLVAVTHRWSAMVYRISKESAEVVDIIDLSSHIAFGIGVSMDHEGNTYVVGRESAYAPEMDMLVLVKIDPAGDIAGSTDLGYVLGDTNPEDPLSPLVVAGIGTGATGIGYVPWARSWNVATGIFRVLLSDLTFQSIPLDPTVYGYMGPGVGIDEAGNGWMAGTRGGLHQSLITVSADGSYEHWPIECPVVHREDVSVGLDGSAWVAFREADTALARRMDGSWTCFSSLPSFPRGLAHDKLGILWAAFPDEGLVRSFLPDGMEVGPAIAVGQYPIGYGDMAGREWQLGPTTGACCNVLDCGACFLVASAEECESGGAQYVFQGLGVYCDPSPCTGQGACCGPGGCVITSCEDCVALTGYGFVGPGTVCDPDPCETSAAPEALDRASQIHLSVLQNPVEGPVRMALELPQAADVELMIVDVRGAIARRLRLGRMAEGIHEVNWNRTGSSGKRVPAGVYWVKVVGDVGESNIRIVLAG